MDSGSPVKLFNSFFEDWLKQLEAVLAETRKVEVQSHSSSKTVVRLLQTHTNLWNELWIQKAKVVEDDVLFMAANLWRTPFERAFSWIGGTRPTLMFQLIYTQISTQTSRSLPALLDGQESSSLAFLTSSQLTSLSTLQEKTIQLEEQLSNQLAEVQTTMPVLPLPLRRQDSETGSCGSTGDSEEATMPDLDARWRTALRDDAMKRLQSMKRLLFGADRLRDETLRQVVAILTPLQALQFYKGCGEFLQAQRTLGEVLSCG